MCAEKDHQLAKQSTGPAAGQVIRWHCWTAICLLAYVYLAVAVAVQRQQEPDSGLDAELIPITVPELLRLLRDAVIPPPRRDRLHRLHWSISRRRRQQRASQGPPTLERLRRDNTVIITAAVSHRHESAGRGRRGVAWQRKT